MTEHKQNDMAGKREWVAPELVRLGTIRDIAQGPTPFNQANNAKRS